MTQSHVVEDQSAVAAFLADPQTHARDGKAPAVERIDTHGAMVFLAGDRAFKLKRAVDYPYMDLSTRAKRERACRAEIALNRRTAPQIYLAARPIVPADGGLAFGDAEADRHSAVDWVVEMHRFDQAGLLDRMADRGALDVGLCEDLAEAVADLHRQAEPHLEATPKAMQWVVEENLEEFREDPELFPEDRVTLLGERAETALARHWNLMDRRCRDGQVRRCHGDLHLRNVVAIDGKPVIFDAIEFNDRLATVDVLYDLAFLLMDLDHRDLRGHGNRVLNRYLEAEEQDEALVLLPLFLSTRAAVRAKVSASIAAAVEDADARDHHRGQARDYLIMALDYLDPPPARLVAVGGLSGTGKTTAARAIAPSLGAAPGAVILRSDVIRKQLFGVARTDPLPDAAYAPEVSGQVYDRIADRAGRVLGAGQAAIADAVYARPHERDAIAAVARKASVAFDGVWLEAPVPVLSRRVSGRTGDASDADAAVVAQQAEYELGSMEWHRVDASGDADDTADGVWAVLGEG